MYKVVRAFFDTQNDNHLYKVGDTYPVKGAKASEKRIKELAKGTNVNRKVYIAEVKEEIPQTPQNDENADGVNEENETPQNPEE